MTLAAEVVVVVAVAVAVAANEKLNAALTIHHKGKFPPQISFMPGFLLTA